MNQATMSSRMVTAFHWAEDKGGRSHGGYLLVNTRARTWETLGMGLGKNGTWLGLQAMVAIQMEGGGWSGEAGRGGGDKETEEGGSERGREGVFCPGSSTAHTGRTTRCSSVLFLVKIFLLFCFF